MFVELFYKPKNMSSKFSKNLPLMAKICGKKIKIYHAGHPRRTLEGPGSENRISQSNRRTVPPDFIISRPMLNLELHLLSRNGSATAVDFKNKSWLLIRPFAFPLYKFYKVFSFTV